MTAILAGVVAAVSAGAQPTPVRTLIEEFRIDGASAELNRVMAIAVASNGNVVVAHDGESALTVFSPVGRALKTFARQGGGPGEVKRFSGMGFVGDSLWVCDLGQNRLTLFGGDGSLGRIIPLVGASDWLKANPGMSNALTGTVCPAALLPGNIALGRPGVFSQSVADGALKTIPLFRLSWDGAISGVIAQVPYGRGQLTVKDGTTVTYTRQPFATDPVLVISPDGGRIAIVDVSETDKPVIRVNHLSLSGDTLTRTTLPFVPEPISSKAVDSAVSAIATAIPPLRGKESPVRAAITVPGSYPPFSRALLANDGTIWVQVRSTDTATVRWLVVPLQGTVTAIVTTPSNVSITRIDRGIWAIVRDVDDIPSIVRFRMR